LQNECVSNKGENEGALVQSLMPQYHEDKLLHGSEEEEEEEK
jgi:hypothetical protein